MNSRKKPICRLLLGLSFLSANFFNKHYIVYCIAFVSSVDADVFKELLHTNWKPSGVLFFGYFFSQIQSNPKIRCAFVVHSLRLLECFFFFFANLILREINTDTFGVMETAILKLWKLKVVKFCKFMNVFEGWILPTYF